MTKAEVSELYKVMFTEYPDLLSINELRRMLGVSKHKAYDLINDGSINAIKIGNAFRTPKINVINYILSA